jgi:hypothetical protein
MGHLPEGLLARAEAFLSCAGLLILRCGAYGANCILSVSVRCI